MKQLSLIATALLGIALCGCGGSGLTTGPVAPAASTLGTPRVEAIIPASASGTLIVQDADNLEVGQAVQFQLVAYDAAGVRVVLTPDYFKSSDTADVFGKLGENSGSYTTGANITTTKLYVAAGYKGTDYSISYQIRPRQARLTGQVVDGTTGLPILGAGVNFYNDAGQIVGSVTMPFQGFFHASVPLSTTRFQVVSDSLPATYWRSFTFNGLRYDAGSDDCRATLPALNIGDNALSTAPGDATVIRVTVRSGSSKPVADGCGP